MMFVALLCLLLVPSPAQGSVKKGVAAYPGGLLCDDFKVLNNMSWWYDWHLDLSFYNQKVSSVCPPGTDDAMPSRVPMVKKYNNHTLLNISTNAQFILGFNEPDHADQANMTPKQAADAWPEVEKHSHGIPLVSPCTAGQNFHWFDEFLRLCHGCRIDYIAAHKYSCDAHEIMSYLQKLHHKYHKKIWLTEFACPHTDDEHRQLHLMQTLLPQLEAANYVFRYSWFMARVKRVFGNGFITPSASLLHNDSSTLTMIGHFYNNFKGHMKDPHLDGESIVQSLTSKVMSVIDNLRTSPQKYMNNAYDNSQFKYAETFANTALSKDRERVTIENHENKSNRKTNPKQAELNISKQSGDLEVVCSDIPRKDNCSHDTCRLRNNTFYKSRDLPASSESLNLSTSFSLYALDISKAKRLHAALGFSESLRKMYLTNSSDSEDDSKSSPSSSQSILQRSSDKESSDEESINNTRERSNNSNYHPEKSDADSTKSKPSQHFESYSSGIFNKTGVIEKGSNLTKCRTDISDSSDFVNESSNLSRYSSDTDAELVKIRYDTTSSSAENTSNISDLNESQLSTRSITEEFKHDIDYLAKSAFRTSTPDLKTTESVENSKASGGDFSVSYKREGKSCSRDSFSSMTDSLFLVPRKSFVHGLSPLCRASVSTCENNSSSHVRVRRSLVFVSPSNSSLYSKARDETVPNDSQEIQTNRSSCNKTPKFMFRDETEEAVYYLITKYLENSQCKW